MKAKPARTTATARWCTWLLFWFILAACSAFPAAQPGRALALDTDQACEKARDIGTEGMKIHDGNDPGSLIKAKDLYLEALTLCPDLCQTMPQVCANLGHAYYVLKQPEKAIETYKQAYRSAPDYGTPYYGLGLVYRDQNMLGFALDYFMKAYLVDRSDAESRQFAAQVFHQICENNKKAQGSQSEDVGNLGRDRMNLENKLLMGKVFSETNRRYFFCEQKAARVEFALRSVTFETAKAVLKKEAYEQIEIVGQILKDNPDIKVILEGHTDAGKMRARAEVAPGVSCSDNMCLSRARANSVKQALVERFNLAPDRITVTAYGDSRPLDTANTPAAYAKNRRVTLVLDRRED
jgi:outer membrane protein OmpA-like peptidoglycan-associated protein